MPFLALLVACQSQDSKLAPNASDPFALTLVWPGSAPYRVARYTLSKGATVDLELALDASLTSGSQGGAMPTLVFDLELTVEDIAADGGYKFRSTISGVHARDRQGARVSASAVETQLGVMSGVSIVGVLQPDGTMVDPKVDLSGKSLPDPLVAQLSSLTQSMQHIATPLPSTPIGVGALWRSMRDVDQNGMKVATGSTVLVRSLDEHTLTYDVASDMRGPDQQLTQQNVAISVSHIGGVGSGHAVVDLSRLAMNGEFTSAFHADMKAQGQESPVDMEMKIAISSK